MQFPLSVVNPQFIQCYAAFYSSNTARFSLHRGQTTLSSSDHYRGWRLKRRNYQNTSIITRKRKCNFRLAHSVAMPPGTMLNLQCYIHYNPINLYLCYYGDKNRTIQYHEGSENP